MYKIPLFILGILTITLITAYQQLPGSKMHATFFDIGQGDATLIQMPHTGHTILIDGGPKKNLSYELPLKIPYLDKRIDLVILTHPHADHLSGLFDVIQNTKVGAVLTTGIDVTNVLYESFIELAHSKNIPIYIAQSSDDVQLGPYIIDVIAPQKSLEGSSVSNLNNASVGIRITYGSSTLLFTGDAEIEQEHRILAAGQNIEAGVYQAGHHGSKTSNTPPLLYAVKPEIVVVQSGRDNRYKHPHNETLDNFTEIGSKILRNDTEGTIELSLSYDGVVQRL